MKWKTVRAEEYCDSVRDGTHDTPKPVEMGYKLVTGKHIKNGQIDSTDAYYISEKDYKKINERSLVEQWDVIMSMIGTIGEVAVVKEQPDYAIKNIALFKCFGSELKGKWLGYYLKSANAQRYMFGSQKGSSQQFISLKQLRSLPILITDETYMQKLVDILSAYDDLIENNQKQIELLEEVAQRLYREWFVDLRFPGYENVEIVNGVPEGWSRKCLDEIADIKMGQSPKSEFYNDNQQGMPFHQGVSSYGDRFVEDSTYSTSYTRIADAGSILFSVRAPVGRLNITKNRIVIGRGLAALNHKLELRSFLFYMLKERFFKEDLLGNGSIFSSITKTELFTQSFIYPSENLANMFEDNVSKIDDKISILDDQIRQLIEARDRLLPKLMSGELEV